jgi:RNA polymerase sigma factor (sigma-70 family)
MQISDSDLIQAVIGGQPEATARFVERYTPFIYALLRDTLRFSQADAEEIYPRLFDRMLARDGHVLRQWRGERKFESYLAVVTRNLAADYIRERHRQLRELTLDMLPEQAAAFAPEADPISITLSRLQHAAICETLQQLSVRHREVFRRRHFQEQNYKEIAAEMGLSVNGVGVALHRAEVSLSRTLCRHYPGLFTEECRMAGLFAVLSQSDEPGV